MATLLASPAIGFAAKALAVVLVAIGLFGLGYYEGHKHAVNAEKAKVLTVIQTQIKYLPQETKVIHDTVTRIQTVHDKVYIDVVKTIPDNRVCDVPAAGVSLLNANRGSLSPAR